MKVTQTISMRWLLVLLMAISCSPNQTTDSETFNTVATDVNANVFGTVTNILASASLMADKSGNWQVVLQWKNPDNAPSDLSFEIQRSEKTFSTPTKTHKEDYREVKSSPYLISNLPPDSTQYFVVIATGTVANTKTSVTSPEYSAYIPLDTYKNKPGEFSMKSITVSGTELTIDWEPALEASFYIIQKGLSSGSYPTAVTRVTKGPYVDKDPNNAIQLNQGKTLYYIVIAVNSVGSSNASAEGSVSTSSDPSVKLGEKPGEFNMLSNQAGDAQVYLSWEASTGAKTYEVKYGTSSGSYPNIYPTTTTGTNLTITDLVNGTTYYFIVVAINDNGSTNSSGEFSLTPSLLTWTRQLGVTLQDTEAFAIAVDSSGNVYGGGETNVGLDGNAQAGNYDALVIKYNSGGTKQWTRQLGAAGGNSYVYGLAVDASGNVYAVGETDVGLDGNTQAGTGDMFVIKYNSSGTKQWTRQLGIAGINTSANHVVVDSSGFIDIVGSTNGGLDGNTLTGGQDAFVVQYDSSGTKLWTRQLGVTGGGYTWGSDIAVDASGTIYFTGTTQGVIDGNIGAATSTGNATFIAKYDSSGNKVWTQQIGVVGADTRGTSIGVHSPDSVYVAGYTWGALDGNTQMGSVDAFLIKYDSSGTKQWSRQFGGGGGDTEVFRIASDPSGYIYLTGYTNTGLDGNVQSGNYDAFVSKYDSSGIKRWTWQLGASGGDTEGYDIAVVDSHIYIAGYTSVGLDGNSQLGDYDLFVKKYGDNPDFGVAVAGNDAKLTLTWSALADVTKFTVVYGTSPGVYTNTASLSALSPFEITNLTNRTIYYFKVTAFNANDVIVFSSEGSAKPSVTCPIGDQYFANADAVNAYNDTGCIAHTGNFYLQSGLGSASFINLETLDGGIYVTDNNSITSLSFPQLQSISGELKATNSNQLSSLSLPNLISIGGDVALGTDTRNGQWDQTLSALTSVDFSNLTTIVGSVNIVNTTVITSLNFPKLETVSTGTDTQGLFIFANNKPSALTSISLPSLTTVGAYHGVYVNIQINQLPNLTALNLSNLTTVGGSLNISDVPLLTSLSLPNLVNTSAFSVYQTGATSLSVPNLQSIYYNNSGKWWESGNFYVAWNASLPQCEVDQILNRFLNPPTSTVFQVSGYEFYGSNSGTCTRSGLPATFDVNFISMPTTAGGTANLSWTASADVTQYVVLKHFESNCMCGEESLVTTPVATYTNFTPGDTLTYTDTVSAFFYDSYMVKAVNANGATFSTMRISY